MSSCNQIDSVESDPVSFKHGKLLKLCLDELKFTVETFIISSKKEETKQRVVSEAENILKEYGCLNNKLQYFYKCADEMNNILSDTSMSDLISSTEDKGRRNDKNDVTVSEKKMTETSDDEFDNMDEDMDADDKNCNEDISNTRETNNFKILNATELFTEVCEKYEEPMQFEGPFYDSYKSKILEINPETLLLKAVDKEIDPITKKEIVIRVYNSKCGHCYEKDSILNFLKGKRDVMCPVIGCYRPFFRATDLRENARLNEIIAERLQKQKNNAICANNNSNSHLINDTVDTPDVNSDESDIL